MKVIALGCAGHIGSCAVRELVKRAPDIEVVIADKNLEAANALASEVGGKTSVKSVDANDYRSLVEAMKGADVVLSTLGPFYVFAEKALKAAIEAKVNFVDIDDDWDATEACLDLNEEAKKANVTAIIGLGATPGITNMMAKYGADQLDRVDDIHTAWVWTGVDPKMTGTAIVEHYFHAITGNVATYRDGKWVQIPALSDPESLEFSSPIGLFEVSNVGHPEPMSIPRYIKGLKSVCNKGAVWPDGMTDMAMAYLKAGVTTLNEVTIGETTVPARSIASKLTIMLPELAPDTVEAWLNEVMDKYGEFGLEGVVLRSEAKGEKQGKPARYSYRCGAPADFLTAFPAVIGALMLMRGQITSKGVFAPEGILDAKVFLKELTKDIPVEEIRVEAISL